MPGRVIENPQFEDIPTTPLRDVFALWSELKRDQGLPRAKEFPLTSFAEHLPFMSLNDFDPKTGRFRVRFFGSSYVEGVGEDFTGRYIDDMTNTQGLIERFMWLVQNKQPYVLLDNPLSWSPKNFKHYNIIGCPLFDDEGNVVCVMVRTEFSE